MRISSITSYAAQHKAQNHKNNFSKVNDFKTNEPTQLTPSFKGCNVFKIVGGIAGLALMTVIAPGAVAIGLGGIGALAGGIAGTAVDEKIDERKSMKESNK